MKILPLLSIFTLLNCVCYGQLISNHIYPSAMPSEADTIKAFLVIVLPGGGENIQSTILRISNDTILYKWCQYDGADQGEGPAYDTVIIPPLQVGIYHFLIEVGITEYNQDDFCEDTSNVRTFTYDTIITVSKHTDVLKVGNNALTAVILNANTIQLQAEEVGRVNIEVLDATGRLYYTTKREMSTGKNVIDMDIPEQLEGMYFYHIQAGGQRKVLKFIKQ